MYLDSAYVAKFYLNEPDSAAVREQIRKASVLHTSALSVAEVSCVFHRYLRQGEITAQHFRLVSREFLAHVDDEVWTIIPVSPAVIRGVSATLSALPASVFIRAGDAIQLVSALEAGEVEVWTNDRHMLAAAPHFGLTARSA